MSQRLWPESRGYRMASASTVFRQYPNNNNRKNLEEIPMDLGLQGRVAIVTGSSDGIGYATALALAREGIRTVICGRREPLLAEARDRIARETASEVLAIPCDVQRLA